MPQPWGRRIRRQAQPYDGGPHGLASLQMLGILTNHPHCMGLGAITLGNLLQQAGRRLAACAMLLRGMRAEKHRLNARTDCRHFTLHVQMNGVEVIHIKTATPQTRLVGGQREMPSPAIELRHSVQHPLLGRPVLERHNGVFALNVQSTDTIQNGKLHKRVELWQPEDPSIQAALPGINAPDSHRHRRVCRR